MPPSHPNLNLNFNNNAEPNAQPVNIPNINDNPPDFLPRMLLIARFINAIQQAPNNQNPQNDMNGSNANHGCLI
jgi:hypothetical protein